MNRDTVGKNRLPNMPKHIDYKDTELLKQFINPHGKILPRRRTRISADEQRRLAMAVKRARFMALLPFIAR